jgi:hypothetical protein
MCLLDAQDNQYERVAVALGRFVTETKDWITPETLTDDDTEQLLNELQRGAKLDIHGMARIAFDDSNLYVNGRNRALPGDARQVVAEICARRKYSGTASATLAWQNCLKWMLKAGAFEIPETK